MYHLTRVTLPSLCFQRHIFKTLSVHLFSVTFLFRTLNLPRFHIVRAGLSTLSFFCIHHFFGELPCYYTKPLLVTFIIPNLESSLLSNDSHCPFVFTLLHSYLLKPILSIHSSNSYLSLLLVRVILNVLILFMYS